jgi:hypothetical protein
MATGHMFSAVAGVVHPFLAKLQHQFRLQMGIRNYHTYPRAPSLCVCVCVCVYTVRSESRCALRLRYVDLVVSVEVAFEVCRCFTVFSC